MLKAEVGTEKGAILVKGGADDLAVDVAYIVARVYGVIKTRDPDGAEEFRDNVCKLMEPDSPVWGPPTGKGIVVCMMVPKQEASHEQEP